MPGAAGTLFDAPQAGHFGAVFRVGEIAVRRQQVGHAADLPATHRVGLAGQRERPGTRPADVAGRQVQMHDRRGVVRAVGGLVQALAPHRQRSMRGAEPARGQHDVLCRHAARLAGEGRRDVAYRVARGFETLGVLADEARIGEPFPEQNVQHRVEQHQVGAGQDRQMQVGHRGGVGAARVDHDDLHLGIGCARLFNAAEHDRVRIGGVAAGHQQAVGFVDVGVAGRRCIGAQRLLVAGHGGGHAQARVGVDVVGADQPLGELVEYVIVLGEQLARDVERHRIRAVLADDAGKARGRVVERLLPRNATARCVARDAQFREQCAGFLYGSEVQGGALGA